MPIIRRLYQDHSAVNAQSISSKPYYTPYSTFRVSLSNSPPPSLPTVNPIDLFIIPPTPAVLLSQPPLLVDVPISDYLDTIVGRQEPAIYDSESSKSCRKAKATRKTSAPRKKTKENAGPTTEGKKSARSRRREPGYFPKPRNAFMIFRSDFCKQGISTLAESASSSASGPAKPSKVSQTEFSKVAAAAWRALPFEQRKVYEEKALQDKERFAKRQLERQREDEKATEFEYEYCSPSPSERDRAASTCVVDSPAHPRAITLLSRQVEIIDLTQDDDDEPPSSSSHLSTAPSSGVRIETSPIRCTSSPPSESTPAPSTSTIASSTPSGLYMPIPTLPIPSPLAQFSMSINEETSEYPQILEEFSLYQTYAYASSSTSSSSSSPMAPAIRSPLGDDGVNDPETFDFMNSAYDQIPRGWECFVSEVDIHVLGAEVQIPDLAVVQWCS